jgi:hypothetical protein
MRRRILGGVAGIAALAVSVALALLGRAVLGTPGALERAAPGWPAGVQTRARDRSFADRAAASLLDAGRADAFAEIVAIYRDAIALPAAAGDPRGPVRISRLIPKLRSPAERAQALTMAGTLLAYSAGAGFGVVLPRQAQEPTQTVLSQAVADFRAAVRSDPTSETAKFDLELLLRQQQEQRSQPQRNRKPRQTPKTQDTRRKTPPASGQEHHAGIYSTGSGY